MLFNSVEFLIFLPIVFLLYWFIFNKNLRFQNLLILVASYVFYGWWSYKFLGLLFLSTLLDYLYGFGVASSNKRKSKVFLWLSIINNLGILAVFKYFNFFSQEFGVILQTLGLHVNPVLLDLALPVGISFYTFHGMSYVFDIYRSLQKPVNSLIDYAVFVSFFPLLVAGPIERANHLLPQVQMPRIFKYDQAVEGCRLILWGLFKKVVIADSIAVYVDDIFQNYSNYNSLTLVIGAIGFAFQIYGDFSGYSDISLGTAKLFGFELLSNFKFPYFSRDIAEFWRRWHISLSSWFKDYLYIPLGGSKFGKIVAVRNTFIIFLVSGFWHGANWTFILWGFIHACGFIPLLLLKRNRLHVATVVAQDRIWPSWIELRQMLTTFVFVTFAWIFFRADNVTHAFNYLSHLITGFWHTPMQSLFAVSGKPIILYIIPVVFIDWYLRHDERHLRTPKITKWIYLILAYIIAYAFLSKDESNSFIYFQF